MTYDTPTAGAHAHGDGCAGQLGAVLFIPAKARGAAALRPEHGLRLYSRKILIQEEANKDLLPDYYRFVDGA